MAFFATAASIAGLVGAVSSIGGGDKNGGAGAQSNSREPWKPAQQSLLDNLGINQKMQNYYQQNPFSDTQKNQYQGLLDTLSNNQAGGNGLLGWANNFGQSNRGAMPEMAALPTGTKAPMIDWAAQNPFTAAASQAAAPQNALPDAYQEYLDRLMKQDEQNKFNPNMY